MGLDALEGDGISDVLLNWLHAKDELGYGPSLWLPDTVVYKFGQPIHWYFTSGLDGKLRRKNKQNLVNVRIEEAFNKRNSGCDLVAYYISESHLQNQASSETTIEYFDRRGLHEFLYDRWKENNGLLQHFIEPRGLHNAIIRAIWSPKVCLLERRVNSKQLHDQRYGLYERAVTYEGPEHFSMAAPLRGTTLPSQIQRLCENLVAHITEVSFQKNRIARMVANFKVDSKDRIWFLWSSSIRLVGNNNPNTPSRLPLDIGPAVQLPPNIKLVDAPNHSAVDSTPLLCMHCISCGKAATSDRLHQVPYRIIIAHFEKILKLANLDSAYDNEQKHAPDSAFIQATGGVGFGGVEDLRHTTFENGSIPPIIRRMHPKLSLASYKRYRRDPLFVYKSVVVCEDCYLVYADFTSAPNFQPSIKVAHREKLRPKNSVKALRQASNEQSVVRKKQAWMPALPSVPAPIYRAFKPDSPLLSGSSDIGRALSLGEIVQQRGET